MDEELDKNFEIRNFNASFSVSAIVSCSALNIRNEEKNVENFSKKHPFIFPSEPVASRQRQGCYYDLLISRDL